MINFKSLKALFFLCPILSCQAIPYFSQKTFYLPKEEKGKPLSLERLKQMAEKCDIKGPLDPKESPVKQGLAYFYSSKNADVCVKGRKVFVSFNKNKNKQKFEEQYDLLGLYYKYRNSFVCDSVKDSKINDEINDEVREITGRTPEWKDIDIKGKKIQWFQCKKEKELDLPSIYAGCKFTNNKGKTIVFVEKLQPHPLAEHMTDDAWKDIFERFMDANKNATKTKDLKIERDFSKKDNHYKFFPYHWSWRGNRTYKSSKRNKSYQSNRFKKRCFDCEKML